MLPEAPASWMLHAPNLSTAVLCHQAAGFRCVDVEHVEPPTLSNPLPPPPLPCPVHLSSPALQRPRPRRWLLARASPSPRHWPRLRGLPPAPEEIPEKVWITPDVLEEIPKPSGKPGCHVWWPRCRHVDRSRAQWRLCWQHLVAGFAGRVQLIKCSAVPYHMQSHATLQQVTSQAPNATLC
jgi:hypothetical protein